jgi:hypothetical protein
LRIQVWTLSGIILANFVAQVFYFFHLYYSPQHPWPEPGSALSLGWVFALFLVGAVLLLRKSRIGYVLMAIFLSLEFVFYLRNIVGQAIHAYGWFFHLYNPDLILRAVFAIGYLNLFVSGYFLFLLLRKRRELVAKRA